MHLEKRFEVHRSRDDTVETLSDDAVLLELLPGDTEVIERSGDRVTTRTHYTALGREGTATFHWTYLLDGNLRFEKVCDGNVWHELNGQVEVDERGDGASVLIEMRGSTKRLVPEFAIKGQMEEQIEQMARVLRERLESA
jgi:carbon monoxide dehydrogenase subunit G